MKPANMLLIAGGAAAVYWWYTNQKTPAATATGTAAGTGTPAGTGTTGGTVNPPAAPAFNSLDAIYTRVAAKVNAAVGSAPQSADSFDWYLKDELPAGTAPPDPCFVFGDGCGRATPMTLANYWGAMAPYLRAHLGLSGLGFYGGLAGISRAIQ